MSHFYAPLPLLYLRPPFLPPLYTFFPLFCILFVPPFPFLCPLSIPFFLFYASFPHPSSSFMPPLYIPLPLLYLLSIPLSHFYASSPPSFHCKFATVSDSTSNYGILKDNNDIWWKFRTILPGIVSSRAAVVLSFCSLLPWTSPEARLTNERLRSVRDELGHQKASAWWESANKEYRGLKWCE